MPIGASNGKGTGGVTAMGNQRCALQCPACPDTLLRLRLRVTEFSPGFPAEFSLTQN
jgi:hypothetical protein